MGGNNTAFMRTRTIRDLEKGNIGMLVCTDVAARGLDFREMTHVVNFELPGDPKLYAHRAGRVGRAGFNGVVISLAGGAANNCRLSKYAEELGITLHECNVDGGELVVLEPKKFKSWAYKRRKP